MKENIWLVMAVAFLLLAASVFPVHNFIEKQRDVESVDGLVYTYIVGKVEGNDDLLASILTEKAQGIIKPGRHAFPGAADEMGERYTIERFENHYPEALLYRVTFYRPYTGVTDFFNVVVVKEGERWMVGKNSSVDEFFMDQLVAAEQGIMVHEWSGEE